MRALLLRLRLPALLVMLTLIPPALAGAALAWRAAMAARAAQADARWQARLALADVRLWLARDRAVLAVLPARPGRIVPPRGFRAAFATDAAGRIPPQHAPVALPALGPEGWGLGPGCPAGGAAGGFVRVVAAANGGRLGGCVDPSVLVAAWRRRLRPGGSLALRRGGQVLLRLGPARALRWHPGPAGFAVGVAPVAPRWPDGTLPIAALGLLGAMALPGAVLAGLRALAQARDAAADAARFADVVRLGAERHRLAFLSAPVPLAALDPAQRVLAANDALLRLTGFRREEVLGQPMTALLAPGDRPAAEQDFMRALAGDTPAPPPRRLRRRDGADLRVSLIPRPERGPDGLVRRIHLAVQPVGTDAAADRHDALARVVGGVAHDFNNLLMVLIGNLERLNGQAERPDAVRRLAGLALRAAERGAALTARLLAAAGTQKLRPELVNPNRLLRETAAEIEAAAGAAVAVQWVLSPLLEPVRLDRDGFRAVVLALVANAGAAMPQGGRLTVETANRPGSGHIAVSFVDTGVGMTQEVLARATEPFFTTRPPGSASGLGLSMADGFARQSGGWLELRSEPGIGTSVALVLPRSDAAREVAAPVGGAPVA